MIAAVKVWPAVWAALLFSFPHGAAAAEDPAGAARELARKTVALAGRNAQVTLTWRNAPAVDSVSAGEARSAFEAALTDAGIHTVGPTPVAEILVTVSENPTQYLLVEDARKGDDRQVWIATWKKSAPATVPASSVVLEDKLVWQQDDPILDIAFPPNAMLVLSRSFLALVTIKNGDWQITKASAIPPPAKPWPRDIRGRLRLNGTSFQARLPGLECSGKVDSGLTMECGPSEEAWTLESGSHALLLATFAPARNYFDGHITTQTGQHKTVPPFYSAASVEDQGKTNWLFAGVDGRVQIFDSMFEPAGSIAPWGSDIAGTDARCGGGTQVLAAQPSDRTEPDGLLAYTLVNRVPVALSGAVGFPGPVTALWPSGGSAVLAVAHDLRTNKYAAYVVTVVCAK